MTIQNKNKALIAYFSYSGNTQIIARQIQKQTDGIIFRIETAAHYPTSYNKVLEQAKQEINSDAKPLLKNQISKIEIYKTIFLGFPNWWNSFPAAIHTFLSENDFSGKTIIPFCTHGGGGIGNSVSNIIKLCPESEIPEAFSINGNAVNNHNTELKDWLQKTLKDTIS